MIDIGHGSPIVMVPGIQGRWEWMRPAIAALGRHHRVLTFSLQDAANGRQSLFDSWTRTIDDLIDRAGAGTAAVVGVSFGGLIAAHYAASRPGRVSALTLVSSPSPWRLDRGSAHFAQRPTLSVPLFAIRGCYRLAPEIMAARPTWTSRCRFAVEHLWRVLNAPISPTQMARWATDWMARDFAADCRRITAPTLLITGEPALDRVVPVSSSVEYLELIPGARHVVLEQTGHIGLVSKPERFANVVSEFVNTAAATSNARETVDCEIVRL
jgi:pimeloyl-ACP methyl ester carboxylesterase